MTSRHRSSRRHQLQKMRRRTYRFETLEARQVLDSTVVFSEIMYHPADASQSLEWIELHNQMAVDIDLTGWRLDDGVEYAFPAGTILAGGGYLVVAADPAALEAATGYAESLGPFNGNLGNGGDTLELRNHTNRLINSVEYDDHGDWPVGADGSGATLAKRTAQSASHLPENWTISDRLGGTPGRANFPEGNTVERTTILPIGTNWRYDQSGNNLGTAWREPGYNDSAWPSGNALLYAEEAGLPAPKQTPLTLGRRTYYFRTTFNFTGDTADAALRLNHVVDDGAVFYLNGQEVSRFNMPAGTIASTTFANVGVGDAVFTLSDAFSAGLLQQGLNTLAVEVHQTADTSSDIVFGTELLLDRTISDEASAVTVLQLSELAAADADTFWLELHNTGTTPKSLSGYEIQSSSSSHVPVVLGDVTIPAGGYHVLNEGDLGFRPATNERLFLFAPNRARVVDAAIVESVAQARSPDWGQRWQVPSTPTPNAPNVFALSNDIVINEVMYHARPTYATDAVVQPTNVVALDAQWRFDDSGTDRGTDWKLPTYDDSAWRTGNGLFFIETAPLPGPKNTPLTFGRPTYYFRTTFEVEGDPADALLVFRHVVDDGAVFYLNGVEFGRFNMPAGPVTYNTLADPAVGDAVLIGPVTLPTELLVAGTNVLAVETHQILAFSPDVVFGAEVSSLAVVEPATEFTESAEEWIELYNRGTSAIDLSGWQLDDAIQYTFPPNSLLPAGGYAVVAGNRVAFEEKHPGVGIVGEFSGSLSDRNERIQLLDATGNLADEVHYYDGGSWPEFADGGGTSLELRSPFSDNAVPNAWASSDETARTEWQHVSYTMTVDPIVHDPPINFHEFVMGLLSAGEVWLDNISVIENPAGGGPELIQNGTFDADPVGGAASKWRIQGTHELSQVIADPDQPGNRVLRLVADARMNYLSNHAETTLANRAQVVNGRTYQISYDARWIQGSPQLHTQLYYKDASRTTILNQPVRSGTPGQQNSAFIANTGPTYQGLAHSPVVPSSSDPVRVHISAHDTDGISQMTLLYRLDGQGAFNVVPMTLQPDGSYAGEIPPQTNGRVVQFYVEGRDSQGAMSTYPAEAGNSRALYKVTNGFSRDPLRHDFQIIMTPPDTSALHIATNMMNNDRTGATIIYDGTEIYYNVGVRLRGSMFTRQTAASTGYNVRFNAEQPFRGVHETVAFDQNGEQEILSKFLTTQSAHLGGTYDDIMRLITPSGAGGGPSLAYLARHDDVFLDEQFENGSDGTLFKFEGIRVMTSTVDGTPEGLKIYQPIGWVANFDIQDLGESKELYRWPFLINRRRDKDDYAPLIRMAKAFSLTGDALGREIAEVMDVDNLTHTFALMSLMGIGDVYSQGNPHNLNFYVRPSDGKMLVFPWDWDFTFNQPTSAPLHGNQNIAKILDLPHYEHFLMGHMDQMMRTVFSRAYMARWTAHYGRLLGAAYDGFLGNIDARSSFVRSQLPANVAFTAGADQTVNTAAASVTGRGWVNVKEIRLAGQNDALPVWWTTNTTWQVDVPLQPGSNSLVFEAYDFGGALIGTDTVQITSSLPRPLLDYLRITEIMYHPVDASAAEQAAGYSEDDFEFIELTNTSSGVGAVSLNLANVSLTDGIAYTFPAVSLAAGESMIVAANQNAFRARYGDSARVLGPFASGRLSNSGERLTLRDDAGTPIVTVEYRDSGLWPEAADGIGSSLELKSASTTLAAATAQYSAWQASANVGGSPGLPSVSRPTISINEVLANTDSQAGIGVLDSIELHNWGAAPVDLSGWWISDSADQLQKYQIPAGTILNGGEYWVVDERSFNPQPLDPRETDFALSGAEGDDIWLTIANTQDQTVTIVDEVHFGATFANMSLGRVDRSSYRLAPQSRNSLGWSNRSAIASDIVLSEVHYHPESPSSAALAIAPNLQSDDLEFVELYNASAQSVDLTGWRIRGGIDFDFPPGVLLADGSIVVLVSFNPTDPQNASRLNAFRAHYGLSNDVQLLGGYAGQLDDSGEWVRLERPDAPPITDPTIVPSVTVDLVAYGNLAPWPENASGAGASLTRKAFGLYGDTVAAWQAVSASPGAVVLNHGISGDFSGDGLVDAMDIDHLYDAIAAQSHNLVLDLNQDELVTSADVRFLVENVLGTHLGDSNLDGTVDGVDFAAWQGRLFSSGTGWSEGDWNGDALTDVRDFNLWNQHRFVAAESTPARRAPRAALPAASLLAHPISNDIQRRRSLNVARRVDDDVRDRAFAAW